MTSRYASKGSASLRRPSMDWPLSREEKKRQAINLFQQDVQTCNQLLDSKDQALRVAEEEIKALRRASTASTRRASTGSTCSTNAGACSPVAFQVDLEVDKIFGASPFGRDTTEDVTFFATSQSHQLTNERAECHGEKSRTDTDPTSQRSSSSLEVDAKIDHPTRQRSSSLEVGSALWGPYCDSKPAEHHGGEGLTAATSQPRGSEGRTASPRRHPTMRRSNSLEAASSWWSSSWKAVRKGATKTVRIIADEARQVAEEVREVMAETKGQDSANPSAARSGVKTEYIEWHIDIESGAGDVGLSLEPSIKGEPHRVLSVTQGLALDAWNSSQVPVTVFLLPGRREAVMSKCCVRPGDELVAIDGEPVEQIQDSLMAVLEEAEHTAQRMRKCQVLTFRRKVNQRRDSAEAGA